jgi:hypothetical protein
MCSDYKLEIIILAKIHDPVWLQKPHEKRFHRDQYTMLSTCVAGKKTNLSQKMSQYFSCKEGLHADNTLTPKVTKPGPRAFGRRPSTLSFSVGSDLHKVLTWLTQSKKILKHLL